MLLPPSSSSFSSLPPPAPPPFTPPSILTLLLLFFLFFLLLFLSSSSFPSCSSSSPSSSSKQSQSHLEDFKVRYSPWLIQVPLWLPHVLGIKVHILQFQIRSSPAQCPVPLPLKPQPICSPALLNGLFLTLTISIPSGSGFPPASVEPLVVHTLCSHPTWSLLYPLKTPSTVLTPSHTLLLLDFP